MGVTLAFAASLALVVAGVALWSIPAAFVVAGIACGALTVFYVRGGKAEDAPE